jgi:hypothetical protein
VTQTTQEVEEKIDLDHPRNFRHAKIRGSSHEAHATPHMPTTQLFDEAGAAKYLDPDVGELQPQTLNKWRFRRKGPRYIRLGGKIRYRKSDLDAWLEEQRVDPTTKKRKRRARRSK